MPRTRPPATVGTLGRSSVARLRVRRVRVALLTREWPPEVYGGAGVHVEHLVTELRRHIDVDVHCFGADRADAHAHRAGDALRGANPVLPVLATDLSMAAAIG